MGFWIRSQDKRILIEVKNIFLDVNYDNKRISCIDDDTKIGLGAYKTKKRALEVLDEIHKCIVEKELVESCNSLLTIVNKNTVNQINKTIDIVEKNAVYEMPKE